MFMTDHVYKVESSKGSYMYALRLADGVTLIDTSFPGRGDKIINELQADGFDQVKRILLTHHDVDHIGNLAQLQQKYQCEVYISETDMPYVQGMKKRDGMKKIFASLMRIKVPERIQPLPVGNIDDIQIIPSPGHTPGHTCFLFDGVLFAGDLLRSKNGVLLRSKPMMTWDMEKVTESVKTVSGLRFDWVCPAHGEPVKTSKIEVS